MSPDYNIIVKMNTAGVSTGRRNVQNELSAIDKAVDRTKKAIAGIAVAGVFQKIISDASSFNDSMAEVSTLVDTAKFNMDELSESALEQSKAFGSLPTEQAAAQYQIISAGASSAAQATETLTAANKLAVGGVTDVATAAGILSGTLNAYGLDASHAESISDSMFVAMRGGITTIGELSGSLGKVLPIAASTGVSFDELTAATAALTKQKISTAEAVTGLRAIMAATLKPTSEAAKLANKLGLEFNATALKSKGFAAFMEDVVEKTGGSSEVMAQLFGGVEALTPAMALAGQAGIDFNNILEQQKQKAGETQTAFDKVSESSGFKFNQFVSQATVLGIQLGAAISTVLLPVLDLVTANFDTLVPIIGAATTGFIVYRGSVFLAAAANTALSGSFGIMLSAAASTTRAFGVAAGAKVLFAGASGTATFAVRGFTAAIIASPLAPLALAITAAGAAYLYFTSSTESATSATQLKAEADQQALVGEQQRAQAIAQMAQATAEERAQTVAAIRAAVEKAKADVAAAKAAIQRAVAERSLAAAILAKDREEFRVQNNKSSGGFLGTGNTTKLVEFGDRQRKLDGSATRLAGANEKVAQAEASLAETAKLASRIENLAPATANINVPSLAALNAKPVTANAKPNVAANDNFADNSVSFSDIEADLNQELRLVKAVGIERNILQEQLRAEDQLKRKLNDAEAESIAAKVKEIDSIGRLNQFKDEFLGGLEQENKLLDLNGVSRELKIEQLRAEDILGRNLTEVEKNYIEALVLSNNEKQRANDLFNNLRAPIKNYKEDISSLITLLRQGKISQLEFNVAKNNTGLERDVFGVEGGLDGTLEQRAAEIEAVRRDADEKLLIVKQAEDASIRSAAEAANLRILIAQDEEARIRAIKTEQRSADIQNAKSTFDSLTSITKDFAGEQSAVYKAMFLVSKAFAIADSVVKIQQGIANALALPFPANLGAVAAVAAQAAGIVSTIKSATLELADGGYVSGPGGSRDDAIPARLSNGEYVVNAEATRKNRALLDSINGGGDANTYGTPRPSVGQNSGGNSISIGQIMINYKSDGQDPKADAKEMADEFERRVREITQKELLDQSRSGGALTRTNQSSLVA